MAERDGLPGDERFARSGHDLQRPRLSSRQAADRIGITPQAVTDGIRRGTIEGYYLQGPQRRRWFAFSESVEAFRGQRRSAGNDPELQQRVARMENALTEQRIVTELKDESYALLQAATKQIAEANKTLLAAYEKLQQSHEVAASFTRSDWVPAYPPGGG